MIDNQQFKIRPITKMSRPITKMSHTVTFLGLRVTSLDTCYKKTCNITKMSHTVSSSNKWYKEL